jgi:hypothetical protein
MFKFSNIIPNIERSSNIIKTISAASLSVGLLSILYNNNKGITNESNLVIDKTSKNLIYGGLFSISVTSFVTSLVIVGKDLFK